MKVAILGPYILENNIVGGVERHVKNISYQLGKMENLEIHVISISENISKDCIIQNGNITVHFIKKNCLPMTISGIVIYPYKIIKDIKKIKPDIVHGQMLGAPYGLATAFLSNIFTSVLTIHTIPSEDTLFKIKSIQSAIHDFIWKKLEAYELNKINHFISISDYNVKMIENNLKKTFIIPNGIDSKWFNIEKKIVPGRLLFVGRISPVKGLEFLLHTLRTVVETKKYIELHIAGSINDRIYFEKISRLIVDLDLTSNVKFIGQLNDTQLLKAYSECELFILPSKRETQGIVLLESMASGTPIIATNVGGIPNIIKDGYNGFLVEYGDINELNKKIHLLLNDKNLYNLFTKNGQTLSKKYLWNLISKETAKLYFELIACDKTNTC